MSFDGQSMLRTVATQRPRISRVIDGSGVGAVDGRTQPATRNNAQRRAAERRADDGIPEDRPAYTNLVPQHSRQSGDGAYRTDPEDERPLHQVGLHLTDADFHLVDVLDQPGF